MVKRTRILLADDHSVVRHGFQRILEAQEDMEVVGEASNGREAVDKAEQLQPDVIIMDVTMPELNGIEATRRIAEIAPRARVLALSMHRDSVYVREILRAGARGYLLKDSGEADFIAAVRAVDEAGPGLNRIDFFNYGEAFLHKRAVEMCEYIKTHHPHIYLYTSTNGGAFTEESARRLVHSGIDEVTFSIDGATPESYVQYRGRGKFDVAMRNLRAMVDEKRKAGRDLPYLNWRYILFKWNDSDAEMDLARRMAQEIGVDRLCWEITDHPEDAFSRRFMRGTPEFERIRRETWDDSNLGNAIPGATPRAEILVRQGWLERLVKGEGVRARAGAPARVETRVTNRSTKPFPADATYGRRLVRIGAQLCREDGSLINLDFARSRLPKALGPGETVDIALELPPIEQPGRYTLKFDLVNEGVEWFEKCGSPTTIAALRVCADKLKRRNVTLARSVATEACRRARDHQGGQAPHHARHGPKCPHSNAPPRRVRNQHPTTITARAATGKGRHSRSTASTFARYAAVTGAVDARQHSAEKPRGAARPPGPTGPEKSATAAPYRSPSARHRSRPTRQTI